MTKPNHIKLYLPELSPAAAYALSELAIELARLVERHYADEIRSHLYAKGQEALEMERIEAQIEQLRDDDPDPDDPIPF